MSLAPDLGARPARSRPQAPAVPVTDAIVLDGLTKRYGRRRGIDEVSLQVRVGEVFGFLGPNGSGKTTAIRTMLDLIRPTAGSATLLGLDSRRDAVEIHRRTGHLPGDFAPYRRMTGRRYLGFFAELRGTPHAAFEALAERLGCDLEPRIATLSHGNVQKLGLIQALMHRPDLLVLDEPTRGLDPLVQGAFHDMVRETSHRGGTVFLSSHVLPEVERTCDRVAIIDEGRLVGVRDVSALRATPLRIVEVRFAGPVPATALARAPGVERVEVDGHVLRCTVHGDFGPFVRTVADHEVVDLQSRPPGLEEFFLRFYEGRRPR